MIGEKYEKGTRKAGVSRKIECGHDGLEHVARGMCKSCYSKWGYKNLPNAKRANKHRNLQKYKLSVDEYEELSTSQGGACAICRRPETSIILGRLQSLSVDHDHSTGKIRGLLCHRCNRSMGLLRDDVVVIRAMARYLESN